MLDIPIPSETAQAHGQRFVDWLHQHIETHGGVISFYDYMQAALYEPGLGYYSAGAHKIGVSGDFITAPEATPVYGALWALVVEERFKANADDVFLELGAGTGAFAESILLALEQRQALPKQYLILEPSPDLIERQQKRLRSVLSDAVFNRITWLDTLPKQPISGDIFANEVIDALPVERFIYLGDNDFARLGVKFKEGKLVECQLPCSNEMLDHIKGLHQKHGPWPKGYRSEWHPQLKAWFQSLKSTLKSGSIYCVDYGYDDHAYYAPSRTDGTLRAFYRHRVCANPYLYPSLVDLTADVNWSAVRDICQTISPDVPTSLETQAAFILKHDMDAISELINDPIVLASGLKQLMHPSLMGERFSVLHIQL